MTHLAELTGIKLSSSQIRRILKKKKYSYVWAKYSLEDKQDPEKRKEFRQKLENYLEIARESPNQLQVWFWAQSRRTEYSARRTCAMRVALVSESSGEKHGVRKARGKKYQDSADADE